MCKQLHILFASAWKIISVDMLMIRVLFMQGAEGEGNMDIRPRDTSCIAQVTLGELNLTGSGVLIAILDSGIDYFSEEFQDRDGNTRILELWDQTAVPNEERGLLPPEGYREGVLYTREMINEALNIARTQGNPSAVDDNGFLQGRQLLNEQAGLQVVSQRDTSGHGTAVAGIAAGTTIGVAPWAELLIIKLGNPMEGGFPRTTQLMRGVNYAVNRAVDLNMPLVINLSFGNTYGDHRGNSLLERFLDNVSEIGRTSIVVGSGNEGTSNGHTAGVALEPTTIELAVSLYERSLSIQLWKHFDDQFRLRIESPGGEEMLLELGELETVRKTLEQTLLLCYVGVPQPYSVNQEVFIDFIAQNTYINDGIWKLELLPVDVVTGEYRFYLPSYVVRNEGTGFYLPTSDVTLTIPSTSMRAITVGAYDSIQQSYADFSGRGYVYRYEEGRRNTNPQGIAFVKPDIVAPGVNIQAPRVGGGYESVTGTSFATPIVAGSAALLMEWGIVRGNDRFLYGEKLKAYLRAGARPIRGESEYPNERVGWGALCVADSIPTYI